MSSHTPDGDALEPFPLDAVAEDSETPVSPPAALEPPADVNERDAFPEFADLPEGPFGRPKTVRLKDKTPREQLGMRNPTHPARILAAEKAAEVFDLRKQGWSERELAHKYGVGIGAINKIISRELDRVTKRVTLGASHMKQLQNERLEFMLKSIWPAMEKGSHRAIEMGLKVMERQSKLNGWDEPEKKQLDITVEAQNDAELIALLRQNNLPVPPELDAAYKLAMGEVTDAEIIPQLSLTDLAHAPEAREAQAPGPAPQEGPGGA